MQQLCLTEEDVKLRRLVCQLLQEVFHEVYSGASVVPFGSTVSGVGWKGSDLDVCLLTGDDCDTDVDYSEVINVLRSFAPGCVNIIPVLGAKCPLIKFKHQPSGMLCDLSVNNRYTSVGINKIRCINLVAKFLEGCAVKVHIFVIPQVITKRLPIWPQLFIHCILYHYPLYKYWES